MTNGLIESLTQRLENPQIMRDYLDAGLHGDAERAPPPIDHYHGIEDFEDVLISLMNDPLFTAEQRNWFWDALFAIARQTWQSGNHEPFSLKRAVGPCPC